MIKRRFYKDEHGDKDEQSSDSSSSSSSDSEVEAEDAAESEDHSEGEELKEEIVESPSSSSGYESDNSSADEINADSTDDESESDKQNAVSLQLSGKHGAGALKGEMNGVAEKDSMPDEMPDFVLKLKSIYRCQLCPRVVCLNEVTMRTHLSSKRHAKKEKLMKENRLLTQLNIFGKIENQETPAEMNARIVALGKNPSKKSKGRQRQKNRLRRKKDVPNTEKTKESNTEKTKESTKRPAKKRRKDER